MLVTSVLSGARPSDRRLSASVAWHFTAVSYNINHCTVIITNNCNEMTILSFEKLHENITLWETVQSK